MSLFTSKRERNLWLMAVTVQAAIFATLGLAGSAASILRENNLVEISFIITLLLVGLSITMISVRRKSGIVKIGMAIGVTAVYWMAWTRIGAMEERTHLFEYSLVSVLIFQALIERGRQGRQIPVPTVLAVVITSLLGWLDEGIQALLPNRYYDLRDVGFNTLAALMAVLLSFILARVEEWLHSKMFDR